MKSIVGDIHRSITRVGTALLGSEYWMMATDEQSGAVKLSRSMANAVRARSLPGPWLVINHLHLWVAGDEPTVQAPSRGLEDS